MDKAIEAFFDGEHVPSKSDGCFDSGADDGIQRRAVSTAREYPYSHTVGEIVFEKQAF